MTRRRWIQGEPTREERVFSAMTAVAVAAAAGAATYYLARTFLAREPLDPPPSVSAPPGPPRLGAGTGEKGA